MANMCSSTICIYGQDKATVESLCQEMYDFWGEDSNLYEFVKKFLPGVDADKVDCGGSIQYVSDEVEQTAASPLAENYYLFIETETKWSAKIAIFDTIAKERGLRVAYTAEEPGFEYYVKWDPSGYFFPHRYLCEANVYIDSDGVDLSIEENEYFDTPQKTVEWIEDIFSPYLSDIPISDPCEFAEFAMNKFRVLAKDGLEDNWLHVHKFEDVAPEEFELMY